jgi:hypothetical protein
MKNIKNYNQFKLLNENAGISVGNVRASGHMLNVTADEIGITEREYVEYIIYDLDLKSGIIRWDKGEFRVDGETNSGQKIKIEQKGEYNMYGGPYQPKMGKWKVTLDGKDMSKYVKKVFKSYGWSSEEDISRTDVWGRFLPK